MEVVSKAPSRKESATFDVDTHRIKLPFYTLGEEIVNAITHGIGALLSIAALVLLIIRAATRAPAGEAAGYVVGYTLFGATLVIMYLVSTLYLWRDAARSAFLQVSTIRRSFFLSPEPIRRIALGRFTEAKGGGSLERFGLSRLSESCRFRFTLIERRGLIYSSTSRWGGTAFLSRRSCTPRCRRSRGFSFCSAVYSIRLGASFLSLRFGGCTPRGMCLCSRAALCISFRCIF